MFALVRSLSSTSSIANAIDEFKNDQPLIVLDRICRMLRRAYVGDIEQRGRPDMTVDEYRLTSPICIMGEMGPDDPALKERLIPVIPSKTSLTKDRKEAMRALLALSPSTLSGGLVRLILAQPVAEHIQRGDSVLSITVSKDSISPRIWDNLLAICIGDSLCREIMCWAGLDESIRPGISAYLDDILDQIIEAGEDRDELLDEEERKETSTTKPKRRSSAGRQVRDHLDLLMIELSTYAQMGLLLEGSHYSYVQDHLYLHLPTCHKIYLQERRRTGEPDRTNGLSALRRVIREKREREGSYVMMKKGRTELARGRPQCIVIDPYRMRQQIGAELPCSTLRGTLGNVRDIREAREAREARKAHRRDKE
jgi:hypothetical protein